MRELLIRLALGIARYLIKQGGVDVTDDKKKHGERRVEIPDSAPVRVRILVGDEEYLITSDNLFDDFILMHLDKLCDAGVADWQEVESLGISYEIESLPPEGGEMAGR